LVFRRFREYPFDPSAFLCLKLQPVEQLEIGVLSDV